MKFKDFTQYFSAPRINRFLTSTANSKYRTTKLYKANLKVSQTFHPLLGILEVVLRNRLNDILSVHFASPDWITNQKSGFMSDPSLTFKHKRTGKTTINDFLKKEILNAENRIRKTGVPITSGKIIAEQTLVFGLPYLKFITTNYYLEDQFKFFKNYLLVMEEKT